MILIDKEKNKVSIDVINENHFTTEEYNVVKPKTVATIENPNHGPFSQLLQTDFGTKL